MKMELWGSITTDERLYRLPQYMAGICSFIFRRYLPHISSMYFYNKLDEELKSRGINLPTDRWFTNLTWVGNVGSVAPFSALDELIRTKPLEKGDKILVLVPESGRFSFGVTLLSVN